MARQYPNRHIFHTGREARNDHVQAPVGMHHISFIVAQILPQLAEILPVSLTHDADGYRFQPHLYRLLFDPASGAAGDRHVVAAQTELIGQVEYMQLRSTPGGEARCDLQHGERHEIQLSFGEAIDRSSGR